MVSCVNKLHDDVLSAYVVHLLHAGSITVIDALSQLAQRMVCSNRRTIKSWSDALKVLIAHIKGARNQVTPAICQISVIDLLHALEGNARVLTRSDVGHEVVAVALNTQQVQNVLRCNGKKVAVVGSGPSGIACAGELARNGFDVTVFEAFFTGGGVLVYGIPEFRLPKAVVKREIDGLQELGVKFEFNSVVGRITDAEELFEQGFDAIYIATGAGLPKLLNIPGENLPNVFFANEYLTRVNLMKANNFPEYDTPTKHGKNVVVFGGGNVAMDAVRTAKRLGAERAIIAYRRTEDEMPARRAELHHAKAEGVEVLPLVSPLEFVAGEDGAVCAVRVQKMELGEPDADGRRRPVAIEGAIEDIPCDVAISAIGTNANPFAKMIGDIKLNKWGYIEADEEGRTSDPRIWAGGDIVTGAATVILAMGAGKVAAASITKHLG